MKPWRPTPVEPEAIDSEKSYFLAIKPVWEFGCYTYASRGLNGKFCWSIKPGIAIRYKGSNELIDELKKRTNLVALLVPEDVDKRWRARKHKRLR